MTDTLNYPPIASRDIRHKAIRAALKVSFPGVKFSVTGSRGTGYGWSQVGWTDGPTEGAVRSLCDRFFGSSFNGMTDGYDQTNNYFVWQGVTYSAGGSGCNTERRISPSYARALLIRVADEYGIPEAERPVIVERLDYLGRSEWDIKDTAGQNAGTRPVYPGADGRRDWLTMVYRASQGSYPFDSEG